jgi:hypothetical protein
MVQLGFNAAASGCICAEDAAASAKGTSAAKHATCAESHRSRDARDGVAIARRTLGRARSGIRASRERQIEAPARATECHPSEIHAARLRWRSDGERQLLLRDDPVHVFR